MLYKLKLLPSDANYSVKQMPQTSLQSGIGGFFRSRRITCSSVYLVTCQLDLDHATYTYFNAFYQSAIKNGANPFLMDLVVDKPHLSEYTVIIEPGSVGVSGIMGFAYTVVMSLRVMPHDVDDIANMTIVDNFDDSPQAVALEDLENSINSDFPGAFS